MGRRAGEAEGVWEPGRLGRRLHKQAVRMGPGGTDEEGGEYTTLGMRSAKGTPAVLRGKKGIQRGRPPCS